ncbi:MAG TPA: hypothetical protein PKM25_17375, partial [Candidatus Ozemobacteraceae bacterium]|nr:hypothetical protein [Candidatus Ozemobacteraceae bacterium]
MTPEEIWREAVRGSQQAWGDVYRLFGGRQSQDARHHVAELVSLGTHARIHGLSSNRTSSGRAWCRMKRHGKASGER